MAYLLDSTTIKAPIRLREENSTQMAEQRTLGGAINRDYFGDNKRIWLLTYTNTSKTDYDTIDTIYRDHLSTGNTKTWEITETNYTVSSVNVQIDLKTRGFNVGGENYISDFTLVLTEA